MKEKVVYPNVYGSNSEKNILLSPFTPSRNRILTFHVEFSYKYLHRKGYKHGCRCLKTWKQTRKRSQRWPHARQNVRVHVQDLRVILWLIHKMCITANQSTGFGAKVGKRTIRHGIQFFSLENISLTICMIEKKTQLRQRWTGNIFFFICGKHKKQESLNEILN